MAKTTAKNPRRDAAAASIDAIVSEIRQGAHRELDALRSTLNTRLNAIEQALSRDGTDPAIGALITTLCETITHEVGAATAQVRAQSEAAYREVEQRLADSESAKADVTRRLGDAERSAAAARDEAAIGAASLAEARAVIDALEQERGELLLARDITQAHLEGEIHKRAAIVAELQVAREQLLEAKAGADADRLELQRASERTRTLERRLKPDASSRRSAAISIDTAALDQVGAALQALAVAKNGTALLTAFVDLLAQHFSRVVLCSSGSQGLIVWHSRGFDSPLQAKSVLRVSAASPLAQAAADWKLVTQTIADGEAPSGLVALVYEPCLCVVATR